MGHTTVPDDVIGPGTTTLHQGRKQSWIVKQTDFVAAEVVVDVLLYTPFGHFIEFIPILATLECGHVPVHAELIEHIVVLVRFVRRRWVIVVVLGIQNSPVRAIIEQPIRTRAHTYYDNVIEISYSFIIVLIRCSYRKRGFITLCEVKQNTENVFAPFGWIKRTAFLISQENFTVYIFRL